MTGRENAIAGALIRFLPLGGLILAAGIIIYMIYALVAGALLFLIHKPQPDAGSWEGEDFLSDKPGPDRVILLEDRNFSIQGRINLIEEAVETLDISYYTIRPGTSSRIFFATILEAADRGVEVRILLDGMFHKLRGPSRPLQYMLAAHPNIELKFFEPFNPFKPWTWNNRLHDKYIIADRKMAIVGGRNIGDRYFLEESSEEKVKDRDILVYNSCPQRYGESVLKNINSYFQSLWDYDHTYYPVVHVSSRQTRQAITAEKEARSFLQVARTLQTEVFPGPIDWQELTLPANKITLIHNPLNRFNKDPWVLTNIARLMARAHGSIFVQSPYVIPNQKMRQVICGEMQSAQKITILTNSVAASPNLPAMTGYLKYREDIKDHAGCLFEYHGEGSIHAKSVIIDDRISIVGTFNADPRSSFLSTESMLVVDSQELAAALKAEVDQLLEQSLIMSPAELAGERQEIEPRHVSWQKRMILNLLRPILYGFDFLL